MKIEIDIPEYYLQSGNPIINIGSETFHYSVDAKYQGFGHNLTDEDAEKLKEKLDKIAELVNEMIREDLI